MPSADDRESMCSAVGCDTIWAKTISEVIPLCWYHFAEAHAAWLNSVDATNKLIDEQGLERAPLPPERKFRPGKPVVYYVKMNGFVKIGTSSKFTDRMATLYVQHADLLAVERGGFKQEASRHQQFTPYRVRGTELFHPNAILDELIAELNDGVDDPWMHAIYLNTGELYEVPVDLSA